MRNIIKKLFVSQPIEPSFDRLDPILQPIDPVIQLKNHRELVTQIKLAWSDEKTWQSMIEPTLLGFARFVGHLPCNAKGLFNDKDGLFRASLQAALYSLQMMESFVHLRGNILTQDLLQSRMRAAALLAGLTAFLSATIENFEVRVKATENAFFDLAGKQQELVWSPFALAYCDWIHDVLTKNPKAEVSITWHETTTKRSIGHDFLSVYLARLIFPSHVLAWLTEVGHLPIIGLMNTMANATTSSSLSVITKARDLGVYRACLLERERLGKVFGQSFEIQGWQSTLIRILRHRVKEDWPINSKDSPLRMGADGLFLFWPDALPFLIDDLKTFGLTDLPIDASLWAGMLMHQGIAQPSKNGTATVMIAVTPNAKPREAIKLDPHYFLDKSQWENLKVTKRDFEVTVSPTIETGLSRLTREVLGLDQKADEIDTSVKTKKPQVLWHLVETTLHPQIQDVLDALMEKLTIEPTFAKQSMVDEGLLLSHDSVPETGKDFDLVVMQLLLADLIYATDRHEPLWIEHITDNGQSVRAVVMKPTVFAIEFIEDDVAIPLDYATLFESIHGREPQNRWEADDHYQLTLTEDDHA